MIHRHRNRNANKGHMKKPENTRPRWFMRIQISLVVVKCVSKELYSWPPTQCAGHSSFATLGGSEEVEPRLGDAAGPSSRSATR
jgi:hypothetical protein